jgi:hypothetical protein
MLEPVRARSAALPEESKACQYRPGVRRHSFALPALAGAAAVLLVVLAMVFMFMPGLAEPSDPEADLTVKGEGDAFFIAVQRGPSRFAARPGDRLLEGDQLGLFYSASVPGYLAVFDVDEQGDTTLLYPAGSQHSEKVAAGSRVPLADGGIVREGTGCEWVVAVFSSQVLKTRELEKTIRRSTKSRAGCKLDVSIPQARTIRIFSVLR